MMNINWWYNIVAPELNADHVRLVCDNASKQITIDGLTRHVAALEEMIRIDKEHNKRMVDKVKALESSSPAPREWVERAQVTAAKQRVAELEQEVRLLQAKRTAPIQGMISGQIDLLRKVLHREKAYTLFLEDHLECLNPSDVFNALPLEKRQEYFDRVDGLPSKTETFGSGFACSGILKWQ